MRNAAPVVSPKRVGTTRFRCRRIKPACDSAVEKLLVFLVVFVFRHDLALGLQVKCWRRVLTTPWSNLADLDFCPTRIVWNARLSRSGDVTAIILHLLAPRSQFSLLADSRQRKVTRLGDIWRVLITIMARKTNAFHQRQSADKRRQGQVRGNSVFESPAKK